MKLLLNFLKIITCYSYFIIGLVYPIRPVYIGSQISNDQIDYIQKSIDNMNLSRTYEKTQNHIRIQYDNSIVGNTAMTANLYPIGSFIIDYTVISFNPNLYDNILGCVILHELYHSQGLMHSTVSGSIMNYTVFVSSGIILNDNID